MSKYGITSISHISCEHALKYVSLNFNHSSRTKPWLTQSVRMASGTVHQAELLAITNAAKHLAGETGKKIIFLVDNQASLKVLAGTNVKFDSVKMTRDELHSLGSTNNVELQWIKAHVGHDGNDAADKAAKKGSTSNRGNQNLYLQNQRPGA
jgi:ribonuclease HI